SVDHVIPTGAAKRRAYPPEWVQDAANQVTCCRACNEFLNAHKINDPPPATLDEFFDLRDRHCLAKREWVQARYATERAWYDAAFTPPASTRQRDSEAR